MNSEKMPLIFLGHGSPMNAIENNIFTQSWKGIGKSIPKPNTILMLSAHWITDRETQVSTNKHPDIIYDMYGFPDELYQVRYSPPGNPDFAQELVKKLHASIENTVFVEDATRGLDHGTWSTLIHLYPQANIPIVSLSLDYSQSPRWFYNLGRILNELRKEGVLIVGSGNIVHNLGTLDWSGENMGYDWAQKFDKQIAEYITERNHTQILESLSWNNARLSQPSHDHLLPLFPLLGATEIDDTVSFYTPTMEMGSLSMRSIVWN